MLNDLSDYFVAIAPIWADFAAGLLSVSKRDQLLAPYRAQLRSLPPSPRAECHSPFYFAA
jgi:hypothetical protein